MSLTPPEEVNANWDAAQRKARIVGNVFVQLFVAELKGKEQAVVIPHEADDLLPDIMQATRTCVLAFTNKSKWRFFVVTPLTDIQKKFLGVCKHMKRSLHHARMALMHN